MRAPGRPAPDPALVARALRQRVELGAPALFLEGTDREALLALADAVRRGRITGRVPTPSAGPPTSASGPSAPAARPLPSVPASDDAAAPSPRAPGLSAPTAVAAPADVASLDLDALREVVAGCTRCALAGTRTQAVFADGSPRARVMVVGEAPGANEDRTGVPFVGAAGKLLDLMLASVDLSRRESVYICNVIKCRPPGNRNPTPAEIDCCSPFLRRQIEVVRPEAILAVGTFAAQLLTGRGDAALGALRGAVHAYEGVPLVVTYHPAALLRNRGWTRPTWDDLQLLRTVLEGA